LQSNIITNAFEVVHLCYVSFLHSNYINTIHTKQQNRAQLLQLATCNNQKKIFMFRCGNMPQFRLPNIIISITSISHLPTIFAYFFALVVFVFICYCCQFKRQPATTIDHFLLARKMKTCAENCIGKTVVI